MLRKLTQTAFVLMLSLAAARCMMLESIREPFETAPHSKPAIHGPDAATAMILDLTCFVPVILILLRRVLDKDFRLRWNWSFLILLPLIAWMALSYCWADDRFAMLISAFNFAGAMALLWCAFQLVHSWLRLRVVAGIAFGLLLVFLVQGFYYRLVDLPDLRANFEQHKAEILVEQGMEPGSFAAKQFELKITGGEQFGFFASANSFAAIIILVLTIGIGVALQQIADRDPAPRTILLLLFAPLAFWLMVYTKSKAAFVSCVVAAGVFAFVWIFRGSLARHAKWWYWLGVSCVALAILAVIGHGIVHHRLPTDSLNFRWRYWVACWTMFWRHPILGVGWSNFGQHYLRDRLPAASEEIEDPHNFLVRFLIELGIIGGALLIAWLLRLWCEFTRPHLPPVAKNNTPARRGYFALVFCIPFTAIIINILATFDFAQDPNFLIIEFFKCTLYFTAILLGSALVILRYPHDSQADDRPAPWILYGILIALGVFLIHNMIEFSLFEAGALCLFGVLAGSVLGIRQNTPEASHLTQRGAATLLGFVSACVAASAIFIAIPVHEAVASSQAGDEALRTGHFDEAVADYNFASQKNPINFEFPFLAGRTLQLEIMDTGQPGARPIFSADQARRTIDFFARAIAIDPAAWTAHVCKAEFERMIGSIAAAADDYQKALDLNPNEVAIRIEFANMLAKANEPVEARKQFEIALWYNDQLDQAEPKRLHSDELEKIHQTLDQLPSTNP